MYLHDYAYFFLSSITTVATWYKHVDGAKWRKALKSVAKSERTAPVELEWPRVDPWHKRPENCCCWSIYPPCEVFLVPYFLLFRPLDYWFLDFPELVEIEKRDELWDTVGSRMESVATSWDSCKRSIFFSSKKEMTWY